MENQSMKQAKSRLMGKLFAKDKKPAASEQDIANFLQLSPSDKLQMQVPDPTPPPPQLARIDTGNARRWPTAAQINNAHRNRPRSASPTRTRRKGLAVRFTDARPEVIGEGGDEAEDPVMEISQRRRALSHPELGRETQNGAENMQLSPNKEPTSFASRLNAELRAEGKAFRHSVMIAAQTAHGAEPQSAASVTSSINSLRLDQPKTQSSPDSARSNRSPVPDQSPTDIRQPLPRQWSLKDAAKAVVDDALDDFASRMGQSYQLFELAAQSVMPFSSVKFEDLVSAAAWWFLRGRLNLESTVKDRQSSPESQRRTLLVRQQAHTDLAKSAWILKEKLPQYRQMGPGQDPVNLITAYRSSGDEYHADLLELVQSITSNLRKLLMSMKRNNFFPPPAEEAPLQQGVDPSIWVKYPNFPQDIISLLSGSGASSLVSQQSSTGMTLAQCFPLGDTRQTFNYGRFFADAYLNEIGQESDQYRCPCIISINRGVADKNLSLVIASQNGVVKLRIGTDKSLGPTWDDLSWRGRSSTLDIRLPRGFVLQIRCASHDFQYLFNMYDYTSRTHHLFRLRDEEEIVWDTPVKAFQHFDRAQQSQAFGKEPVTKCLVRLFEKRPLESSSSGTLKRHAGFRLVILTSPKTKSLSGVSHDIILTRPIQFGFLRGDAGAPALLLKIDDGKTNSSMIFTFEDQNQRASFHSTLSGSALQLAETVYAHVPLASFSVAFPSAPDTLTQGIKALNWQNAAVFNRGEEGAHAQDAEIIMSDSLRIVLDAKEGTFTDHFSVGPGGVRMNLSCDPHKFEMKLFRGPQQDMTMMVSESQISKDLPPQLRDVLATAAMSESIRSFTFHTQKDMHAFQAAATGFTVVYDGLASAFAITRRMMVVSIHKKWEATVARMQILRREKILQLVVFFEGFSHGKCMNFMLKGTDVYESSKSGGKYFIKIIDAKFALPKEPSADDAFVCLDLPEYPSEHDDLTISFDTEAERERFAGFLPAPTKAGFRMAAIGSLKRTEREKDR